MHEVSLGGTLADYLTGEARERTTYEDLRQALARFLVEEKGWPRESLRPRYAVRYEVDGEIFEREADLALCDAEGIALLLVVFCPGQPHTYAREVVAMGRLAEPRPAPLVLVTALHTAELLAVRDGAVLAEGLAALPAPAGLEALAAEHPVSACSPEARRKESRILHAYTGFLKTCCGETCTLE